jgi:hypothetical protein
LHVLQFNVDFQNNKNTNNELNQSSKTNFLNQRDTIISIPNTINVISNDIIPELDFISFDKVKPEDDYFVYT